MFRPFCAAVALAAAFAVSPVLAQNGRVTFLHINDVYEIAPVDGQGGFAELMTLLRQERGRNPGAITTLGGDFLSPSLLSGTTQGRQMVDLLNAVGIDVAVFGNHEFDFGPDVAKARMKEAHFPWLGANLLAPDGTPFGGAPATWTRTVGDVTVGFFGVLTQDTETLSNTGSFLKLADVTRTAADAVKKLKAGGANVVVALTHLDIAADRGLARTVKGIDLILGGHDHDPITFYEGGTLIVKAGSDAHYLAAIDLDVSTRTTPKGPVTSVVPQSWRLTSTGGVTPDAAVAAKVRQYTDDLDSAMTAAIGTAGTDLDSRKDSVRTRESAMGNLIADALRVGLKTDVGLMNGGGIRGDGLIRAGAPITRKDVLKELPFANVGVVVALSGADLLAVLENGFSRIEDKAGRFPQLSGMTVTYDPKAPTGARVVQATVGGKPLDPAATYTVATNDYLLRGGDGYDALKRGKVLVDPSAGTLVATLVMDHIQAQKTVSPAAEGRITEKK
ncbi:2',3'-cyclic-nucleotide 2'-phosphodiesterase (5'-nucleotidase family) [Azospirillum fermentarium]|uniref:bifunctional metallophosphatase/5'-nucleotidase n=1 Tax=Azospirillum fermentarium TaxID=1233114 RepID=UPI002226D6C6|nr:bifunctional UDP-sugar hydrolase/5'-nucleotidase [Azospirillum fermentarium]MCW2246297.1 2',3'-cyclic-nucleotide 2'-phosphodiesterase (5'-nucleotidase family) [Azospirillum fermentarium]